MLKILLALVVGIGVGVGAYWLLTTERGRSTTRSTMNQLDTAARGARDVVQSNIAALNLRSDDIKEELARTGQVVRRNAAKAGQYISDATADARTTAAIKGRLLASPDLSSMGISVNTTEGIVTLSGAVASNEQISKAMLVAMETDGVREVISTLRVSSGGPTKVQVITNAPARKN